jgi:hypothetical protein
MVARAERREQAALRKQRLGVSGKIRAADAADVTPDLKTLLGHRVGKACAAFSGDTSGYFEFNRSAFA